jgi:hypothetical protein
LTKTGISDILLLKEIRMIPVDSKEFGDWLKVGVDNSWITTPFCHTHDLDPGMTEEEQKEWEDGGDPCQHVLRLNV